jgi:hypothetical protein
VSQEKSPELLTLPVGVVVRNCQAMHGFQWRCRWADTGISSNENALNAGNFTPIAPMRRWFSGVVLGFRLPNGTNSRDVGTGRDKLFDLFNRAQL